MRSCPTSNETVPKVFSLFGVQGWDAFGANWEDLDERMNETIVFATLRRSPSPNDYLACPRERSPAVPDEEAPRFSVPATVLYAAARKVLAREPRTTVAREEPEALRLVLVQRSRLFRFPDVVTLQVFARPEGGSELAIYSRSVHGHSDLGVNRRRVRRWLGLVAAGVATDGE